MPLKRYINMQYGDFESVRMIIGIPDFFQNSARKEKGK